VITLTYPGPGLIGNLTRIGVGMAVYGTITGPTLLDDYINVQLIGTLHNGEAAEAQGLLGGLATFQLQLGPILSGGHIFVHGGIEQGEPVNVVIQAYHHAGVLFDSVILSNKYANDGISGLGLLPSTHDPVLDQILTAVRKTF